eukprot:1886690-Pleurochrysis_carterae.AAC.2
MHDFTNARRAYSARDLFSGTRAPTRPALAATLKRACVGKRKRSEDRYVASRLCAFTWALRQCGLDVRMQQGRSGSGGEARSAVRYFEVCEHAWLRECACVNG